MDLYFRGRASANKGYAPENMAQARCFYERALELDPGNIEALVGNAWVDAASIANFLSDDRSTRAAAAEAALTKVLLLAPNHAMAQYLLGAVHIYTNRAQEGIAKCEHALGLDRNLADAHHIIGMAKIFTGRAEETESYILEAMRLSPRDTFAHSWVLVAGLAKLYLGRDEEAAAWVRRAVETNPNYPVAHFFLASALAHLGQMSEARDATRAGLALDPTFTIQRYRVGASSNNPIFLAQRERIYEGMRKAGVPEG
jgi:tetratricopeptide (TPR) repeat protein